MFSIKVYEVVREEGLRSKSVLWQGDRVLVIQKCYLNLLFKEKLWYIFYLKRIYDIFTIYQKFTIYFLFLVNLVNYVLEKIFDNFFHFIENL